jgi:hypothetical protein
MQVLVPLDWFDRAQDRRDKYADKSADNDTDTAGRLAIIEAAHAGEVTALKGQVEALKALADATGARLVDAEARLSKAVETHAVRWLDCGCVRMRLRPRPSERRASGIRPARPTRRRWQRTGSGRRRTLPVKGGAACGAPGTAGGGGDAGRFSTHSPRRRRVGALVPPENWPPVTPLAGAIFQPTRALLRGLNGLRQRISPDKPALPDAADSKTVSGFPSDARSVTVRLIS